MCVSTYLDECLPTPAEETWMQGELLQLSRSCPWFQKKYQQPICRSLFQICHIWLSRSYLHQVKMVPWLQRIPGFEACSKLESFTWGKAWGHSETGWWRGDRGGSWWRKTTSTLFLRDVFANFKKDFTKIWGREEEKAMSPCLSLDWRSSTLPG